MESVRSLIRVFAVLLRLFIKSRLYLERRHPSKVSTVAVRRLKVFSRLPVVSSLSSLTGLRERLLMKGRRDVKGAQWGRAALAARYEYNGELFFFSFFCHSLPDLLSQFILFCLSKNTHKKWMKHVL